MPIFRLILITLAISTAPLAQAGWKDAVRPYIERFFGRGYCDKTSGEKEISYKLPKIPEISKDGRSTDVYNGPEDPNAKATDGKDVNRYHYKFLVELYGSVKDKKPTSSDTSNWMNALSQGDSRRGLSCSRS